jgi:branched-chain amino acid transport system ATP-binding protein
LLDEPSLGLAPAAVREVVVKLRELATRGTTIVLVEQNAAAAFKVARRGYVLERGRLLAAGSTAELAGDPRVRRAYLGVRG